MAAPAAVAAAAPGFPAPPVDLRVVHESHSIGLDGIERSQRRADRVVRRTDQVWVERERPAALQTVLAHDEHDEREAHAGHGHAHEQARGAPLHVRRLPDGAVSVRMVLADRKRLIEVERAEWANVGYGGSWEATYRLLDTAALAGMTPLGALRKGVQRYRLEQPARTVEVDWDVAGGYARRIEQRDRQGLSTERLTATPVAAASVLPWTKVEAYSIGDYSDLLD